jgi:hypothetical protein
MTAQLIPAAGVRANGRADGGLLVEVQDHVDNSRVYQPGVMIRSLPTDGPGVSS